jgi:ANTAR domain
MRTGSVGVPANSRPPADGRPSGDGHTGADGRAHEGSHAPADSHTPAGGHAPAGGRGPRDGHTPADGHPPASGREPATRHGQGHTDLGPANDGHTAPMEAVARRTPNGWRVGDEEVPDLTSAMVLADLLAAELAAEDGAGSGAAAAPAPGPARPGDATLHNTGSIDRSPTPAMTAPAGPPPGTGYGREARPGAHRAASQHGPGPAELAETEQLRETVAQLERALTVRVRVEQAIGVLAERHRIRPRQAFELLRSASRSRGQRVMETASQVIASATNPLLRLPEELAKPPMARRVARRSRTEP